MSDKPNTSAAASSESTGTESIVLVYNADSGLFGAITDSVHKVVSPETYACNLCGLTFGLFSMRSDWRSFLESLPFTMRFLHRDEFAREFPDSDDALPAIFLSADADLRPLVDAATLNGASTLDELKGLVRSGLSRAGY